MYMYVSSHLLFLNYVLNVQFLENHHHQLKVVPAQYTINTMYRYIMKTVIMKDNVVLILLIVILLIVLIVTGTIKLQYIYNLHVEIH